MFSPLRLCAFASNPPLSNMPFVVSFRSKAAAGIEPAYKGFADLRLATWLRRLNQFLVFGFQF
jgi:hypothetical protein